ncbi:glycogen-binding domain-containing protein [Pseudotenacibaculum haliotis]|uniref:Glycogen-binding domain-containing protein n=1 Tax=Pseudotenacibaculum haliotis TaxID=1862138 RepID=A0ABW5LNZ5_9FLAO
MNRKTYILFFILSLACLFSFGQKSDVKGYRIEGDEIVFSFNKSDYAIVTHEKSKAKFDFDDFDIDKVVVSGQFNNWSRDGWKMKKLTDDSYELRKKIAHFQDDFTWEFKFYVNDAYWAEPSGDIANVVPAKSETGKSYYTYNLKIHKGYPSENGNKTFLLKGFSDANKVILTGSFNKWDEENFEMKKTKEGWKLTLQLRPDTYEYKFIVDGEWIHDPLNPAKVKNEYEGYNSVFSITSNITFILKGYSEAQKVILAGSFNNWNEGGIQMKKYSKGWKITLPLHRGKHHYKFIVDGRWMVDPTNSVKEYDGHGNINSVKMVK